MERTLSNYSAFIDNEISTELQQSSSEAMNQVSEDLNEEIEKQETLRKKLAKGMEAGVESLRQKYVDISKQMSEEDQIEHPSSDKNDDFCE